MYIWVILEGCIIYGAKDCVYMDMGDNLGRGKKGEFAPGVGE